MKKLLGTVAAVAALTASAGAQAGYLDIDAFTVAQSVIDTTADGIGNWSGVSGASIIGGHREVMTNLASSLFGGEVKTQVNGTGFLSFSSESGSAGDTLIRWDGSNVGGASVRNYDLALDLTPFTTFSYKVYKADAGFKLTFTLFKSAASYSIVTVYNSDAFAYNPLGTEQALPISAFYGADDTNPLDDGITIENVNFTAADLSSVGALEATASGAADFDFTIGKVTAVPEPASLALVGLGLLGVGALRRRRGTK